MPKVFSMPVSKIDIEEINNGDFLKLKLYAISDTVNRNGSEFLREGFEESIPTIYNKPILAYFNKKMDDAEEHNSRVDVDRYGDVFYDYDYDGAEKPVGVIPESAEIYVEQLDGKNWVVINSAYIWTEYNKRLIDVIKRQITKKVSVEIESVDSWEENGVEKIRIWKFLGITILGKDKFGNPIEEGIEGAKLVLDGYENSNTFNSYKSRFSFAMSSNKDSYYSEILEKYGVMSKVENTVFAKQDEYGTGKPISVDKSKEAVSNDSWGDVDKTTLRDTVLKARNYKTLVKSVYLDVQDGWENSPSEKLKYPVMQYKDGKFVYNAGGLLSAQQYGEKYDESIAKKALTIRKRLGLVKSEKEEKMKKFIEAAKISGFAYLGLYNGKLAFAQECDCDKEEMAEDKSELCLFEVDKELAENYAEGDEFAWDEITGRSVDLTTRDDGDHNDYSDDGDDDDDDKKSDGDEGSDDDDGDDDDDEKEELKKKVEALEKEKCEMAQRCEAAEKELDEIRMAQFKEDTDAILADENEDMDEKTHEELVKMRDEGKFSCVEDFAKEVAYRKYLASKEEKKEMSKKEQKLSFGLSNNKTEPSVSKKNILIDKLAKI
jgi:hypothetical protein|nr:MAG TPA: Transcription factor SPT20, Protein SPT3, Transcription, Histone acetyltransferase, Histone.3A [Caudoviricetes sp.]